MTTESRGNITCDASEEQGRRGRSDGPMYTCVNKHVDFQAAFPLTRLAVHTPGSLNPNTIPGSESGSQCQRPNFALSVSQRANTRYICLDLPFPENTGQGWEPSPTYKAAGAEFGVSPCSPWEELYPLTQLAPGPSSDLKPPVTYFPLLLFLEVLMSMQNSAEAE